MWRRGDMSAEYQKADEFFLPGVSTDVQRFCETLTVLPILHCSQDRLNMADRQCAHVNHVNCSSGRQVCNDS